MANILAFPDALCKRLNRGSSLPDRSGHVDDETVAFLPAYDLAPHMAVFPVYLVGRLLIQPCFHSRVGNAGVVTVPGSAFGEMGEGYLRLVFANSDENLKEAVRRIAQYVAKAYPDMK